MYSNVLRSKLAKSLWPQLRCYSTKVELKTLAQKKQHYGNLFPTKLLNKKQKTPAIFYLANEKTAQTLDCLLEPYIEKSSCNTILELNPGIGLFTRKLLDREDKLKKILLMESMDYFMDNLQEMHSLYPDRVKVKLADLTNIWKLVYQDKLDNGNRVQELLRDIPRKAHNQDPNLIIFGAIGSYQFLKHLINSIVFQNSFLTMGRPEMYLVLPPPLYLHLSCTNEIGYMVYRSTTILFQILFEYRFIAHLPREDFLPTQAEYNTSKGSKLRRVRSVNPEHLYLVRIIPRRNIFDFITIEDLPALWYFVKQNCVSRRNRIIPNLEKWIPGCGPRLIVNKKPRKIATPLYEDEDASILPQYSAQCMSISNHDYYPNINIYTQFGDLTPSQFLTLFSMFRSWPEYEESSFLASFENNMLKLEASAEDSVEGIAEEDDDQPQENTTPPMPERSLKDTPLDALPQITPRKSSKDKQKT
ncbi:dimethyladenosine transferase 2, mitochondrial [Stomoxys calcitrans]|uniref:rRNA adenine N(6)-methyltransferase n=1 Tax=Stomoxys calcitrans TaxID=35570 RepID=A0A1I8QD22_STOCA|nr:dimethyladenosine transferase 2, mitochondrial [Stomoxys calcitrans]